MRLMFFSRALVVAVSLLASGMRTRSVVFRALLASTVRSTTLPDALNVTMGNSLRWGRLYVRIVRLASSTCLAATSANRVMLVGTVGIRSRWIVWIARLVSTMTPSAMRNAWIAMLGNGRRERSERRSVWLCRRRRRQRRRHRRRQRRRRRRRVRRRLHRRRRRRVRRPPPIPLPTLLRNQLPCRLRRRPRRR